MNAATRALCPVSFWAQATRRRNAGTPAAMSREQILLKCRSSASRFARTFACLNSAPTGSRAGTLMVVGIMECLSFCRTERSEVLNRVDANSTYRTRSISSSLSARTQCRRAFFALNSWTESAALALRLLRCLSPSSWRRSLPSPGGRYASASLSDHVRRRHPRRYETSIQWRFDTETGGQL